MQKNGMGWMGIGEVANESKTKNYASADECFGYISFLRIHDQDMDPVMEPGRLKLLKYRVHHMYLKTKTIQDWFRRGFK